MIRKSPGLLFYLKLFLIVLLLYKLHKKGHLIKLFPFFKSAQAKIFDELAEFKFPKSEYEELNLAKDFDLPEDFDLPFKFIKKVKRNDKKRIKIPSWVFYLWTNKKLRKFFKNSIILFKYKNTDPSDEYLDKKLINSILEELDKLDKK